MRKVGPFPLLHVGLSVITAFSLAGCGWLTNITQHDSPSISPSPSPTPSPTGTAQKFHTNFGRAWNSEEANAVAQQSDGKLIVAGRVGSGQFQLVRYNTNGSLDTTFGEDGFVTHRLTSRMGTSDIIHSLLIQSDGKIIAGGGFSYNGYLEPADFAIVRYNADGTLDTSFGTNGITITDLGGTDSDDYIKNMVIQSDGKIVAAGNHETATDIDFAVVRYNSNGTLDTSFGTGGIVLTDLNGGDEDFARGVGLQADGKIVVGGYTGTNAGRNFAIVRYDTTGALDTTYGAALSGIYIFDTGAGLGDVATDLAIQSDGKAIISGYRLVGGFTGDYVVARLTTAGVLDATFGTGGITVTSFGGGTADESYAMTLQGDGKIILAGMSNSTGTVNFALIRYNTDGSLDVTFNATGKVVTKLEGGAGPASGDYAHNVLVQADGKIVLVGETDAGGQGDFGLTRYTSAGALDATFDTDGIVFFDIGSKSSDNGIGMILQDDGKVVVAGQTNSGTEFDFAIIRYNADGSLDSTFGTGGKVVTDVGTNSFDHPAKLLQQADGKFIVAGTIYQGGLNGDFGYVRYNTDGSLDTSFGTGGKKVTDLGGDESVNSATLQPSDGKIVTVALVGAIGAHDIGVTRHNADGSIDNTFGTAGSTTIDLGGDDWAIEVTVLANGKILIVGDTDATGGNDSFILRLNSNGSVDGAFGTAGHTYFDTLSAGEIDGFTTIKVLSSGKILVGGYTGALTAGATRDTILIRFNDDGSIDNTFGTSGISIFSVGIDIGRPSDMAILADGKIILAGSYYTTNSEDPFLIRCDANGAIDTSFGTNGLYIITESGESTGDSVRSISLDSNGDLILGGSSTDSDQANDFAFIRAPADGE